MTMSICYSSLCLPPMPIDINILTIMMRSDCSLKVPRTWHCCNDITVTSAHATAPINNIDCYVSHTHLHIDDIVLWCIVGSCLLKKAMYWYIECIATPNTHGSSWSHTFYFLPWPETWWAETMELSGKALSFILKNRLEFLSQFIH